MAAKLYKAADVCELAQLQPYVLRSWEKEFPGIGVQQSADGPRVYRESDLEQVRRIKQLVFVEGLTLAGARRRLEDAGILAAAAAHSAAPAPVERRAAVTKPAGRSAPEDDVRVQLASVREGLRSILDLLGGRSVARVEEYRLEAPVASTAAAPARAVRKLAARRPPTKKAPVAKRKRASA